MPKIVFSDIDGTLVHGHSPNFELVGIEGEERYVSLEAIALIEEVMARNSKFALVTGRRKSGYDKVSQAIPHDYAIIEHGCVVLDENKIDEEWAEFLKPVIGPIGIKTGMLWDYEKQLLKEGFKTDSEGRLATVRVYIDRPDNLSEEEQTMLKEKIAGEVGSIGITTTLNEGMLDMLPVHGGKANAANYTIAKQGHTLEDVVALVNDVNDLDILQLARHAACPGNAILQIKQQIAEKGGYVSSFPGHGGTIDMLRNYVVPLAS